MSFGTKQNVGWSNFFCHLGGENVGWKFFGGLKKNVCQMSVRSFREISGHSLGFKTEKQQRREKSPRAFKGREQKSLSFGKKKIFVGWKKKIASGRA